MSTPVIIDSDLSRPLSFFEWKNGDRVISESLWQTVKNYAYWAEINASIYSIYFKKQELALKFSGTP